MPPSHHPACLILLVAALATALPALARADGIMLVQAGAFWMGSDDGDADERPLHRVFVRDFWIERRKAARGDDRRRYPWGAAPPSPGTAVFGRRYNVTEAYDDHERGVSPYGVEDLLGNLREWRATALRPYPYRADDGRDRWRGEGPCATSEDLGGR